MTIKKTQIEKLYELYKERFAYMTEHMEYAQISEARAIKAFHRSEEMDEQIEAKTDEIGKEAGVPTAFFAKKLLDAVFPRSISRYMQCLAVCGVEIRE